MVSEVVSGVTSKDPLPPALTMVKQNHTSKLSSGCPTIDPSHDNTPLKNARNARKAIKLAAMLATNAMAVEAPLAAASMIFLSSL